MKFTKTVTALALALCVTAFGVSAATGIVGCDRLNIRSGPSTDSTVVGSATGGSALTVNEYTNGWYRLNYGGNTAYASAEYVSIQPIGEGLVSREGGTQLRMWADASATLSEKVENGTKLQITAVYGDFYEVLYFGNLRYVPAADMNVRRDGLSDRSTGSSLGQRATEVAANYIGTPYVYGGTSAYGFDCSGFTMFVYSQLGISLPHSSRSQASCGVAVDKSNLVPGDLLFFNTSGGGISHVGIYVGNGKFVHSPLPGKSVCYNNLSEPYYASTYLFARRVAR